MFKAGARVALVSIHDPHLAFTSEEHAKARVAAYLRTMDFRELPWTEHTMRFEVEMLDALDFAELEDVPPTASRREVAAAKVALCRRLVRRVVTEAQSDIGVDAVPPAMLFDIAGQIVRLHSVGTLAPLA